jgi:hypothetical protein
VHEKPNDPGVGHPPQSLTLVPVSAHVPLQIVDADAGQTHAVDHRWWLYCGAT